MERKYFKNHEFKDRVPQLTYDVVFNKYLRLRGRVTRLVSEFHSEVADTNVGEASTLTAHYEKRVRYLTDEVGYELGIFDCLVGKYENEGK